MASIPTFGFSAFLRIICSNEKPKRRAIVDRHRPSKKGGYDYHRNLRNSIKKLAVGSHDLKEILAESQRLRNHLKDVQLSAASSVFSDGSKSTVDLSLSAIPYSSIALLACLRSASTPIALSKSMDAGRPFMFGTLKNQNSAEKKSQRLLPWFAEM